GGEHPEEEGPGADAGSIRLPDGRIQLDLRVVGCPTVAGMLRCLRIPYSTNVERVALAAGHKGLEIDWIDVPAGDRAEAVRGSGQPLVPVLPAGDQVIPASTAILRHLEAKRPEPPLWPPDLAARAALDVFLEWFNLVWKGPPNAIEAELG